MSEASKGRISIIIAMLIFGTVGIFSKQVPLPSGSVALARSVIGLIFLIALMGVRKRAPSLAAIRKNALLLVASGICLGLNWVLFFAACRATTVPTATLAYYLAPAFMVIGALFIYKEKISPIRASTVVLALLGMLFASGVIEGGAEGVTVKGILFGGAAAIIYAAIVLMNKGMKDIDSLDKTACQFAVASLVLAPYTFIIEKPSASALDLKCVLLLLIIGILHTGVAYALYFGSISKLSPTSVGMLGYIDPIVSIAVSVAFFSEPLSPWALVGALLIIGASAGSELLSFREQNNKRETKNEN